MKIAASSPGRPIKLLSPEGPGRKSLDELDIAILDVVEGGRGSVPLPTHGESYRRRKLLGPRRTKKCSIIKVKRFAVSLRDFQMPRFKQKRHTCGAMRPHI